MSTVEIIGVALVAVVQVLTIVLHQVLTARRNQQTLNKIRAEVTSLRPEAGIDNPNRLCQNCFHVFSDHANGSNFVGGPCNLCACSAFVKR